ncbi:hypothetical protein L8Q74_01585 [Enterobacter roggenkampii]|nr:hypothetical protein [Enterobacter roggenkampii]
MMKYFLPALFLLMFPFCSFSQPVSGAAVDCMAQPPFHGSLPTVKITTDSVIGFEKTTACYFSTDRMQAQCGMGWCIGDWTPVNYTPDLPDHDFTPGSVYNQDAFNTTEIQMTREECLKRPDFKAKYDVNGYEINGKKYPYGVLYQGCFYFPRVIYSNDGFYIHALWKPIDTFAENCQTEATCHPLGNYLLAASSGTGAGTGGDADWKAVIDAIEAFKTSYTQTSEAQSLQLTDIRDSVLQGNSASDLYYSKSLQTMANIEKAIKDINIPSGGGGLPAAGGDSETQKAILAKVTDISGTDSEILSEAKGISDKLTVSDGDLNLIRGAISDDLVTRTSQNTSLSEMYLNYLPDKFLTFNLTDKLKSSIPAQCVPFSLPLKLVVMGRDFNTDMNVSMFCDVYDRIIRPVLEWFFYILTAIYVYTLARKTLFQLR